MSVNWITFKRRYAAITNTHIYHYSDQITSLIQCVWLFCRCALYTQTNIPACTQTLYQIYTEPKPAKAILLTFQTKMKSDARRRETVHQTKINQINSSIYEKYSSIFCKRVQINFIKMNPNSSLIPSIRKTIRWFYYCIR